VIHSTSTFFSIERKTRYIALNNQFKRRPFAPNKKAPADRHRPESPVEMPRRKLQTRKPNSWKPNTLQATVSAGIRFDRRLPTPKTALAFHTALAIKTAPQPKQHDTKNSLAATDRNPFGQPASAPQTETSLAVRHFSSSTLLSANMNLAGKVEPKFNDRFLGYWHDTYGPR